MDSVVFLSAVRTAIGTFGGTLRDVSAIDLGTVAASAAIERSNVPADQVGLSVFGNVIQGEGRDPYLSRVVSVNAGVPKRRQPWPSTAFAAQGYRPLCQPHSRSCWAMRPWRWRAELRACQMVAW